MSFCGFQHALQSLALCAVLKAVHSDTCLYQTPVATYEFATPKQNSS